MNETIQELISNAKIAITNGQIETALELYERAIAEDEFSVEAHGGAGKACLFLNRLQEAEQHFQKALELDNENGELYFDLANVKFGLEDYSAALKNYAKAEQLGCSDETHQKLYYQIGVLSHMSGDINAALLNFKKADELGIISEGSKEILARRIQLYIELGDFASAEDYALQLKLLAPTEFRSYQVFFQALLGSGKFEEANEALIEVEKYIDVENDLFIKTDMCINKAMIHALKAESDTENAAEHYQAAITVFNEFLKTPELPREINTSVSIAKAEICLKLEDFDEALKCVDGIVVDDFDADYEQRAEKDLLERIDFIKLTCYLGKEDYESAEKYAASLKTSNNEQFSYFATYADAFIAQKVAEKDASKAKAAEDTYNNAIAYFKNKAFENPQNVFAVIFRARLYAENGKYAMADELIKILPDALKAELRKYVSDCRAEHEKE